MGTVSFKSGSEKGFSLIEVCIALIVISLLMIPMIQMWNIYVVARKTSDTRAVLDIVNSALVKYVAKYEHYPVPENPNIALGGANSGAQATEPASGWPVCAGDDLNVCRTTTNTFPTAANPVLIGTIPYAALGLPYRSAVDGYGHKLVYAVTQSLTASATFDEDSGGIEVLDDTGASIYGPLNLGRTRSHFFIGSHGEDSKGGFSLSGALISACGTNADSTDFENCNGDGTFRNNFNAATGLNVGNFGAGVSHFDDYSLTNNRSSTGIWTTISQTPNMRSSNMGNVAIGPCPTNPCVPKAHVDVYTDTGGVITGGTVAATGKLKTARICPYNQPDCVEPSSLPDYIPGLAPPGVFSAEQIVGAPPESTLPDETDLNPLYTWDPATKSHRGAGIICTNGRALVGITNRGGVSDEICIDYAPIYPGWTNSCAAGTFPRAITFNGTGFSLTCTPP